jgi:Helix-turn-helix domain
VSDTPTSDLLDEAAAAGYLGDIPAATLRQWRYLGRGPAFVHVGRHIRYRRHDLDRWLAEQTVHPEAAS